MTAHTFTERHFVAALCLLALLGAARVASVVDANFEVTESN